MDKKMEWEEYRLKEVLADKGYIRGPFGSSLKRNELHDEGIPVYEQLNAIYDNRDFRYFIDEFKYKEMSRFTVKENDLLISCSGTLGKVSIIKKNDPIGIISQALLLLRPRINRIIPDFLKYFFISDEGYNSLISRSSGSVQVNLAKREIIETIKIPLPPLPEQRAIAEILSSIDDKIELNNQMNRTLEETAQAIFKQWFVDFKYPSAINEGFKPLVNSELGPIPEGWVVKSLYEFGEYINGRAFKTNNFCAPGCGLPIIKIAELKNGLTSSTQYTELNVEEKYYLYDKDLLFSWSGSPNTSIDTFIWQLGDAVLNQHIFKVIPNSSEEYSFLYLLLKYFKPEFIEIASHKQTTGLGHVTINDLKRLKFVYPDSNTIECFNNLTKDIFNKMFINNKQSQTLSTLRDTLLPKLMSGELRVPEEIVNKYEGIN